MGDICHPLLYLLGKIMNALKKWKPIFLVWPENHKNENNWGFYFAALRPSTCPGNSEISGKSINYN